MPRAGSPAFQLGKWLRAVGPTVRCTTDCYAYVRNELASPRGGAVAVCVVVDRRRENAVLLGPLGPSDRSAGALLRSVRTRRA
jgi:hypothetical protein